MITSKVFRIIVGLTLGLGVTLSGATQALAAPPINDDFDAATSIGSLPYSITLDTSEATSAGDDPTECSSNGSVWFSYTPTVDSVLRADTIGSNYDTVLSAYTGIRGSLSIVPGACNDDTEGLQSQIVIQASAGTTYYFMIGYCCGFGEPGGGSLKFSVEELIPPINDDFANATQITLGFTEMVDNTAAGLEPGELSPSCESQNRTVWYRYMPDFSGSITIQANQWWNIVAAYTGSELGSLTEVGCRYYGEPLPIQVEAGTPYYFQVGSWRNSWYGSFTFRLDETPPPTADFGWGPEDPSIYDMVEFCDWSSDPVYIGISDHWWDFGDGVTTTGNCVYHRYTTDGDYPVWHNVQTTDGRTDPDGVTHNLIIRTHDLAAVRIAAPKAAIVGQTRQITVYIKNNRYFERAEIQLHKSVPGGYEMVTVTSQNIPVRLGNRTTAISFSYTFTQADAAMGKVTFKVFVNLVNARDALPGDNEAISQPTKVQ